ISDGRYTDSLLANERRMQRLGASPQAIAFNSKTARVTTDADYEREYSHAYDRAQALIDQGYDPRDLPRVFDEQLRRAEPPLVMSSSLTDDGDSDPTQHRLAQPPLRLAGLPSFGRPDATAPLSIVILCRPTDPACVPIMRLVQRLIQDVYADEARGVWAPWFDVTREDARDLALLGDAALCAEQIGTSPDVLSESSGWRWIMRLLDAASRSHGRRVDDEKLEKLILSVAAGLSVDTQRLSACMSRAANRTFELIAELRKSGVRSSPAVVIGGRIYPGLSDEGTIRKLIDAELAPGVLGESSDSQFERLLFFLSSPKGK
ncbi:MAG TPA: hypothetical protein VK427_07345, partial [Kofleriaceae bacterium]|nr:hypothetical protein [Kofleriaceae bacterium]